MTETPPTSWALIEGDSTVRGGCSLTEIAGSPEEASVIGFEELLRRLRSIDPLAPPISSALAQIRQYAAQARQIMSSPQGALTAEEIAYLASTYEAGIMAGFSDLFYLAGIHKSGPFEETELEAVGSIGWWHGDAVRQQWCSNNGLMNVLRSSLISTPDGGVVPGTAPDGVLP